MIIKESYYDKDNIASVLDDLSSDFLTLRDVYDKVVSNWEIVTEDPNVRSILDDLMRDYPEMKYIIEMYSKESSNALGEFSELCYQLSEDMLDEE